MADLELVTLTINHLEMMVAIDQICFGEHWPLNTYRQELNSPNSHFVGVMNAAGVLIGMGCFWAILDEAHITLLAVHPEWRRQGCGQQILGGLLAQAVKIGMLHSTLEVRGSNQAAIDLYQKMGFESLGWRTKYYQNPEEDAVVMWLRGLQHPEFLAIFNRG
jgi:[ribosomal protein S18]-alanine N-acetyltransferase